MQNCAHVAFAQFQAAHLNAGKREDAQHASLAHAVRHSLICHRGCSHCVDWPMMRRYRLPQQLQAISQARAPLTGTTTGISILQWRGSGRSRQLRG